MAFVAVAAAGVGAIGSIAAGAIGAGASEDNAKTAAQSAAASLAAQGKARDQATKQLTPWSTSGASARGQYNALLGLGGGPATAASPGTTDTASFFQANPDMAAEWAKPGVQNAFGGDASAYIAWHQTNYPNESRAIPTLGGTPATAATTPQAAQDAAMGQFKASPFYTTLQASQKAGQDSILSTAAASGRGTVSGKAQRAVGDFTDQEEQGALSDYMNSLNGVQQTGFQADTGIASGGQTYANAVTGINQNSAAAQTSANNQGTDAITGAIGGVTGAAGYAAGNYALPAFSTGTYTTPSYAQGMGSYDLNGLSTANPTVPGQTFF